MLTSEQFSFHLARYAKVKEEDASAFMEAVTQLLLEHAKAGEEVNIQGLGTFVVIDSQQGRRLGFQVDEKMRKQVNAPFSCFEPMVLAAEMKKNDPEPIAEPEPSEEPATAESIDEEPTGETPADSDEESVVSVDEPAVPEESPSNTQVEDLEQEQDTPEGPLEEPMAAVPDVAETKPQPDPVIAPKPAQQTKKKRQEEESPAEIFMRYVTMFREGKAEPWMWGVLAVSVLVLILLIWLLIPSRKEKKAVAAPAVQQEVVAAPADSVVEPVTAPEEQAKTTAPVRPSAGAGKKANRPTDEMILHENGEPKKGKLGPGGRLTLLALRNYGDKAFWAYIYDVNAYQLGDPNNVPIGLPLYLPDPKYYGIDASDPASIKKAQLRARQILKEWGEK